MNRFPIALILPFLLAACTPEPRPLEYGHDQCQHCRMTLTDARFGAELVTPQGKRLPFDALECMAAYVADNAPETHSLWAVDFTEPGTLHPVEEVVLYRSPAIPSPMGMNLSAFTDTSAARGQAAAGVVLSWGDVVALMADAGNRRGGAHSANAAHE